MTDAPAIPLSLVVDIEQKMAKAATAQKSRNCTVVRTKKSKPPGRILLIMMRIPVAI
jgi:hypothetical protein